MRKLINYGIIVLTCIAFVHSSTLFGQDWSKEQKEVWKVVNDGWAAWKSGDVDMAFANIHEKYLGWSSEDPLPITKAKWKSFFEMYKEFGSVEYYDIEPARILVNGNNAVVYYYYDFATVFKKDDKKKESQHKGKNVEFYIKENGKWMLFGDMSAYEDEDD